MSLNKLFDYDEKNDTILNLLDRLSTDELWIEEGLQGLHSINDIHLTKEEQDVLYPELPYGIAPSDLFNILTDSTGVKMTVSDDSIVTINRTVANVVVIEFDNKTTKKEVIEAVKEHLIKEGKLNESLDKLFGYDEKIEKVLDIIKTKFLTGNIINKFLLSDVDVEEFKRKMNIVDIFDKIDTSKKISIIKIINYYLFNNKVILTWGKSIKDDCIEMINLKTKNKLKVYPNATSYKEFGDWLIKQLGVNESMNKLFGLDTKKEKLILAIEDSFLSKPTDYVIKGEFNSDDDAAKCFDKIVKKSVKHIDKKKDIIDLIKLYCNVEITWVYGWGKNNITIYDGNGNDVFYVELNKTTNKEFGDWLLSQVENSDVNESLNKLFDYDEKKNIIIDKLKDINVTGYFNEHNIPLIKLSDEEKEILDISSKHNEFNIQNLLRDFFNIEYDIADTGRTVTLSLDGNAILDTDYKTTKEVIDAVINYIENDLNEASEWGDDWSPEYVVKPHKDDKIFKFVKSEYKPLDKELHSYKSFIKNFKKYRNKDQVKKLNQNLSEEINIKINKEMNLLSKEDFKKNLKNKSNRINESLFKCEWDQSTYGGAEPIECGPEQFNEDNGYEEEDIAKILALNPGESISLDGGHHTVTALGETEAQGENPEEILPAATELNEPPHSEEDASLGGDEDPINEFLDARKGGATVPVFKGLSAHNKPVMFIEPHKTPEKIAEILASGKDVVITADIARQVGVPDHKKESEFNVESVEGNMVKVVSAKYKKEYDIIDTRKIEEIYIVEKVLQEAVVNSEVSADAASNDETKSTKEKIDNIFNELTSISKKIFNLHNDELLQKMKTFSKIGAGAQKIVDLKKLFEEMQEELKEYPSANASKDSKINESKVSKK